MACTLAAVGCVALALAASAGASTQRDTLIRPGIGIGKVRLGMTLAQVRAAWGRPQAVTIEPHMRGGRTIHLQYDFGAYEATLSGGPGRERVVSVATTLAKEKTPLGLGPGRPSGAFNGYFGASSGASGSTSGTRPGRHIRFSARTAANASSASPDARRPSS